MRRQSRLGLALVLLVAGSAMPAGGGVPGVQAPAPPAPNPAATNPHLGNAQSIRSGMTLYRIRCADCHALDATGYRGPDLIAVMAAGATDERLFHVIRNGVPGTDMPPAREFDTPDDDLLMIIAYLRKIGTVAPTEAPIGNVENGARLFAAQCSGCHRVAGRGGRLGPDLTRIGISRSRAALVREIRTPSEWITPTFETVTVVTKDGQRIRGVKKNEDVYSIQVMNARERIQGFVKSNLQDVIYDTTSLMPAFGPEQISEADLKDLVGYLSSLREADVSVR
jgi:putative heme-binding domain-containing protein